MAKKKAVKPEEKEEDEIDELVDEFLDDEENKYLKHDTSIRLFKYDDLRDLSLADLDNRQVLTV